LQSGHGKKREEAMEEFIQFDPDFPGNGCRRRTAGTAGERIGEMSAADDHAAKSLSTP
jgi:hypothetical protein